MTRKVIVSLTPLGSDWGTDVALLYVPQDVADYQVQATLEEAIEEVRENKELDSVCDIQDKIMELTAQKIGALRCTAGIVSAAYFPYNE